MPTYTIHCEINLIVCHYLNTEHDNGVFVTYKSKLTNLKMRFYDPIKWIWHEAWLTKKLWQFLRLFGKMFEFFYSIKNVSNEKVLGAKIQIKHNFKIEHEQYLNINLKKINKVVSIFFLYFSLLGNYKITTECDDNLFFQQIFHYYTHFISYHRFLNRHSK